MMQGISGYVFFCSYCFVLLFFLSLFILVFSQDNLSKSSVKLFLFVLTGQSKWKGNVYSQTPSERRHRRENLTFLKHNHNEKTFCLIDTMNDLDRLFHLAHLCHLFVFVCPLTRYSEQSKHFLHRLVSASDEMFFSRSILIFTHMSKEQKTNIKEEIENVSRIDLNIRKLISTNGYLICSKECFTKDSESRREFRKDFANKLIHAVVNSIVSFPCGNSHSKKGCNVM